MQCSRRSCDVIPLPPSRLLVSPETEQVPEVWELFVTAAMQPSQ